MSVGDTMFDKVLKIIKDRDVSIPRLLLLNYKDFNISDQEMIVLIYLINANSNIYNPKDISSDLKIELVDVLTIINSLSEKGILKVDIETKGNKKAEVINLDSLYEKLSFLIINEEEKKDTSIYTMFEKEFGRSLSPVEYELINNWKDASYSDELISLALKEAIYNGVTSLKYIDRILEEWHKKGINNKDDVIRDRKEFKEHKKPKKEIYNYDWLNDEE